MKRYKYYAALICLGLVACSPTPESSTNNPPDSSKTPDAPVLLEDYAATSFESVYLTGKYDDFTFAVAQDLASNFSDEELNRILSLDWENPDSSVWSDEGVRRFLLLSAQSMVDHQDLLPRSSSQAPTTNRQALVGVTKECGDLTSVLSSDVGEVLRGLKDQGIAGAALATSCVLGATTGPGGIGLCAAAFAILIWSGAVEEGEAIVRVLENAKKLDELCSPGLCGARNEICCAVGPACDFPTLECVEGVCQNPPAPCGGEGEACCDTGDLCSGDLVCDGASCRKPAPCGGEGEACCETGEPCSGNLVCDDASCSEPEPCGGEGEACCDSGALCSGDLVCDGASCSKPDPCGPFVFLTGKWHWVWDGPSGQKDEIVFEPDGSGKSSRYFLQEWKTRQEGYEPTYRQSINGSTLVIDVSTHNGGFSSSFTRQENCSISGATNTGTKVTLVPQ